MPTLYNPSDLSGILARIDKLSPATKPLWGKMNVAQMLAHCHKSMQTALGEKVIPRVSFIPRMIGAMLKSKALSEKPFGKNSPTDKSYIFPADLDFEEQKSKAIAAIKKFSEGGPAKCTTHPHPFFGHFTPEQWGVFEWKHLDHHLRQFGV